VICVNRAQAGRLDDFRGMVRTVPNWMPAAPQADSARGIREELGLDKDVVPGLARLDGCTRARAWMCSSRRSAPARPAEAALVILGEGPQRAELERLRDGDPRIHLPGYRSVVHGLSARPGWL